MSEITEANVTQTNLKKFLGYIKKENKKPPKIKSLPFPKHKSAKNHFQEVFKEYKQTPS